ncbi:MAG: hypothetical protein II304_09790 [Bacteroidales bacterium]|nr:hypothetical protein [Bacteroidales bacterium]
MAKKKTGNAKMLTRYEEDCVFMSYRYCIGRHTIASHCHAEDIAKNAYGRMTSERTQFMSEDINNEIHSQLHYGNFVDMGWYGNIPKTHFKPLDVLYSILNKESINSLEKFRQIKSIAIDWNREKNDFDYSIYYFNENDKNKDLGRSLWDITDLEVWQQLANLFDLNGHKLAKVKVDCEEKIVCYYECWHATNNQGVITYEKRKHSIDSPFNWSINEECIVEDDINPNKE